MSDTATSGFEKNRVVEIPNSAYYIPKFITEKQEEFLISKVYQAPLPKWTVLSNRRLQNWGGFPHPKGMIQENLPEWLQECGNSLFHHNVFESKSPNHVLVNEYKPGQGIMPHKDGPLYFPTVATISLGCHTLLEFYADLTERKRAASNSSLFSLLLERRSLLILKEDMYTRYLHGISENEFDDVELSKIKNTCYLGDLDLKQNLESGEVSCLQRNSTRVSLTLRHVSKTMKFKFRT